MLKKIINLALPLLAALSASASRSESRGNDAFGLNVWSGSTEYITDMVDLGAKWARIELRKSSGDYNYFRSVLAKCRSKGIKVLLLIDYESTSGSPGWKGSDTKWNAYRKRFASDLHKAMKVLAPYVDAIEIWNEPDHQLNSGYDPGVPANQFGRLLAESENVIRQYSQVPLIIGGMATKRYDYYRQVEAAAGSLDGYHALGVHTYGPPSWSLSTVRYELRLIIRKWNEVSSKPIWFTEAGAVNHSSAYSFAVDYLTELFTISLTEYSDVVEKIFYFSWHDKVGFPGEEFGLIKHNGTKKPAYTTYKNLSQSL